MRHLLRVFIFIAVLWSAYWFIAGYGLRNAITGWFDQQQELGWQADFSDVATAGYPTHHTTRLNNPALADPVTGTAWSADWIEFESPAIWPGRQILRFADTPQRLSYFDQTATIEANALQAHLQLRPGVALVLEKMALTAGPWSITENAQALAAGETLELLMEQTATPEAYSMVVRVDGFTPGDDLRNLMETATSLPQSFDTLELDMVAAFDKPWDRSALEQGRPQPVRIDLKLAEAKWGGLRLFATGALDVDTQGIPTGEIAVKAENWRDMIAMANAAGALPDQAVDPVTRALNFMAGLGGNPNALDLQLNFRDGFVALGPLPLGPAPRLILR
ncbi:MULTISPECIES: DUF2125 domain-containing protein [unclassified Ruegeria]|uniref:DUF2125 domain-containing protein n=1 Tax=unclassified Ruegeria TaxID=2625375 RepID=UPI001489B377|nr:MULTISPECIES: DUF2125 domain-containing protein [unclassified Ruegeria]NOD62321.1 DUF2125 domain-containing protein [Ruegeria sp. HKCCD6109]